MSKDTIPTKVDPFRFADNGTRLQGTLPINEMTRLKSGLASDEGGVDINLLFGVDEEGIRFLRGHLKTDLIVQCQRCMETFKYGIIDDFMLGIVETEEQADELPERFDPVVVKDEELSILEVVEDELIVSLPIVPMHKSEDCKVKMPFKADSDDEAESDNPFKVIELLRTKKDKGK